MLKFDGRVAIVTGAGGGLGREYALELAARGCRVVVNDVSPGRALQVVEEIAALGAVGFASETSVSTRDGGAAIVEAALRNFGRVDILISNAGILRTAPFEEMTDEDIEDVLAVHLKGAFYVGQPAFAAMRRQGYGRILLTASPSGIFGHPWQASYAAAKAGLMGLSNVIALEGEQHGVLCNVLMPNARTRMTDDIDLRWAAAVPALGSALDRFAQYKSGVERLAPEWVKALAVYLVSEQSRDTHGMFSAVSGRFAKVFVGATEGWCAPSLPTVEDVVTHWSEITDQGSFIEPMSVYDEALHARESLRRNGLE